MTHDTQELNEAMNWQSLVADARRNVQERNLEDAVLNYASAFSQLTSHWQRTPENAAIELSFLQTAFETVLTFRLAGCQRDLPGITQQILQVIDRCGRYFTGDWVAQQLTELLRCRLCSVAPYWRCIVTNTGLAPK